ncbi:conjugal transfer protein [Brevibacterium renqingii]|uniref:conjugal transfer protein n=1 Tax=Brevibacterium renqingii TaxID=2776916 RepID=UPI001AE099C1|nr:conjugal transfer protein [Brevibacterium renqingii]
MLGLLTKTKTTEDTADDADGVDAGEEQRRPRRSRKQPFQFPQVFAKKAAKKTAESDEEEPPAGRVMVSTQHNAWIRRAVGYTVIAAIACGPVALVQVLQDEPAPPPPAVEAGTDAAALTEHDRAGAFGVMVVSKWLTATRADSDSLGQYFADASTRGFETKAMEIARPSVVSATKSESGLWSVVVAVDTKSTEKVKGQDDKVTWTTRHFEIPVHVESSGEAIAQRAPSMVSLPSPAPGTAPAYGEDLNATGAIAVMSGEFLNALLAGDGDVSRLTTPGSDIAPVDPAAFTSVTVSKVQATAVEVDEPTAGDANDILVTAVGKTAAGESIPLQYSMSILSRDGRWEVKALTQPPAMESPDEADVSPSEPPSTQTGSSEPTPTN